MSTALNKIDKVISSMDSNEIQQSTGDNKTEEKEPASDFRNYLAIESVGGAMFDPKSDDVVFVYNASGLYQVYKTSANTDKAPLWPTRLTYSEDRCTAPRYLSDGTIVYVSDKGGNENFQLYLIDENNKTHKISTDNKAKFRGIYTSDNYLYYVANVRDKAKFDVYRHRIPILDNKPEIICPKLTGIAAIGCVSPFDENIMIIINYISNAHSENILIDMNNDGKQLYLNKKYNADKTYQWYGFRFIDKKHILCITNYQCDFRRPVVINIDTLNVLFFKEIESSIKWDYEDVTYDPNDKFTYYAQNIHGYSQLYRAVFSVDEEGKNGVIAELMDIPLPCKGVLSSGDQRSFTKALCLNSKNNLLAITMSNSIIPRNMYVIDLENELKCNQITNVSTPGIDRKLFADSELKSFKSFDGLEINYFKYKPQNNELSKDEKFPTIIVIHGGPESQYRPSFKGLIQFYLAAGFMVIAPNVRGSRGYGRTFMDADNVEKRMDSVKDVYELVKNLKENQNDIDNDRLIVYGGIIWRIYGFIINYRISRFICCCC